MRRRIAGWIHRFAYWLDCRADDIWDVDVILNKHLSDEAGTNP